jgi:hypothetical protein
MEKHVAVFSHIPATENFNYGKTRSCVFPYRRQKISTMEKHVAVFSHIPATENFNYGKTRSCAFPYTGNRKFQLWKNT